MAYMRTATPNLGGGATTPALTPRELLLVGALAERVLTSDERRARGGCLVDVATVSTQQGVSRPSALHAPRVAPSLRRGPTLLLDLRDRIGELVQIGAERGQEAQEGMPADAAVAVLNLGYVRGSDLDTGGELLLRQSCPITQGAQRVTKGDVVPGGVVGGLDHPSSLYRWAKLRYARRTIQSAPATRQRPGARPTEVLAP
jgi:hypothetical protein